MIRHVPGMIYTTGLRLVGIVVDSEPRKCRELIDDEEATTQRPFVPRMLYVPATYNMKPGTVHGFAWPTAVHTAHVAT